MTTTVTGCIVHDRKYLSKFHGAVNQLRRLNEFSNLILQQLPKRCCSCHGQAVYSYFPCPVDHLRKICHQIQSSRETMPVISRPSKHIHYVVLEFSSKLNHIQRASKASRFVGRGGKDVQLIQCLLGIRLNIINEKSSKYFRQIVDQLKQQNKQYQKNALWILITAKRGKISKESLERVKQSLKKRWRKILVLTKDKRSGKNLFSRETKTSEQIKRR